MLTWRRTIEKDVEERRKSKEAQKDSLSINGDNLLLDAWHFVERTKSTSGVFKYLIETIVLNTYLYKLI